MNKTASVSGAARGIGLSVKERKDILNIASLTTYASAIRLAEYCLSKSGVSMMTKLFADRLADHGINIYEIRPGLVKTDMTRGVREKYDTFIPSGGLPIQRWVYL